VAQAVQAGLSERRACQLFRLSRHVYRYRVRLSNDAEIRAQLQMLAEQKQRWGFQKMFAYLRNRGYRWNHKRVYRVYRAMGLNIRIKPKKRLPTREPKPLEPPSLPNRQWSLDFMRDSLRGGRTFRSLNILDEYNREALWIEIDTSLPARRVTWVLDRVAEWRGAYPRQLRLDNGPEFIAREMAHWAEIHQVTLAFIEPGKPAQNAYIERFNRTFREDVLDAYSFENLAEVRALSEKWLEEYNTVRPHQALGNLTPCQYKALNT